jgi:hypothetical protein
MGIFFVACACRSSKIMDKLFPETYEASRTRFLKAAEQLRIQWSSSRSGSYPLTDFPGLAIDWLWMEPPHKENLVIVSTGQHGLEGYVGSAMLQIFMDEYIPRINMEKTGLLLIHAINPWGMKHQRKVNENGVDLNRNFIYAGPFDPSINPGFSKLKFLLAPSGPVRSFALETVSFARRTLKVLLTDGSAALSNAALLGQYIHPKGMFYGGDHYEKQTTVMIGLFQEALENYQSVLHLDLHSGYGPRYQMTITLVPNEPLSSAELSAKFHYPLVLRGDRQEFYATHGDMTAYLYELRDDKFPDKHIFATALEFGTVGDSLPARLRSLRAMILESQLFAYGSGDENTAAKIRKEFQELYFPAEQKWREKATSDARDAFDGILSAYGILSKPR